MQKVKPFKTQLLKWIGNKQRFAHEIVSLFPERFGTYYEPFLGSGAVLGTLAPPNAVASDSLLPFRQTYSFLPKQEKPKPIEALVQRALGDVLEARKTRSV